MQHPDSRSRWFRESGSIISIVQLLLLLLLRKKAAMLQRGLTFEAVRKRERRVGSLLPLISHLVNISNVHRRPKNLFIFLFFYCFPPVASA